MAGEGATGEKFNLPNTCPKWTSWDAFEWHWPTDHKYINFLAVGSENFGQNSNMAAPMLVGDNQSFCHGAHPYIDNQMWGSSIPYQQIFENLKKIISSSKHIAGGWGITRG